MNIDYLIVGSGLTGATIARLLSDAGREVLVLERRCHLGGNVYDQAHPSGVRIHAYGPHYFRTGSEKVWRFVNRFSRFYRYDACVKSWVDGAYENWPIAASYIERVVGKCWQPEFRGTPTNFEEASLAMMPRLIYEKFVKGYTEKQWGVPADKLSASLARRFEVRLDDDPRLVRRRYRGLPETGYASLMTEMLSDIPIVLNFDYLRDRKAFTARKLLVFTGPIDEFFDFRFGPLTYRGQQRTHSYFPDAAFAQPCGQVNHPSPGTGPHIRTLEWKHMMPREFASRIRGTVVTTETAVTPDNSDQFEYPFPDARNTETFQHYARLAATLPNIQICGRLGEYKYLDMDQAIGCAMRRAARILAADVPGETGGAPEEGGQAAG